MSASILERLNLPLAQYVVSGIPLGSMPEALRADIVAKTRAALAPGGQFLVYQFTSRVLPVLQRTFRGCLAQHGEAQHSAGTPVRVRDGRRLRL